MNMALYVLRLSSTCRKIELQPSPSVLYVVSMGDGFGVHKLFRVVHSGVLVAQSLHASLTCPPVGRDAGAFDIVFLCYGA